MKGVLIFTILIGLWTANGEWVDDLSALLVDNGISEGIGVGTVIGLLKFNSSETVVFSTTSEYFDVLPNGTVSLKKQLVYKTLKTFPVTFAAKVPSQAESTRTFFVKVLPINHAPTFDATSYRVSLSNPNLPVNSLIYNSILVTDSDEGANGTVTVVCDGTLNADASQTCEFFSVIATRQQDGTYLVSVYLAKALNSSRQTYILSLKAIDGGSMHSSATLQLTVESLVDTRPVFMDSQIIIALNEFEPLRSVAGNVKVRDGRPSAAANFLNFNIQDDSLNWFGVGQFVVSPDGVYDVPILVTGNISLKGNNTNTRYTFNFYAIQLVNGQPNGVQSSIPVTINIRDVNDNAPTFGQSTYAAFATEGLTNGATIAGLSILVFDNDQGNNSYFELSVESSPSPAPGIFGLIPTSGQGNAAVAVIVNRPEYVRFSNQLPRMYTLTLTARETRTVERRSSTATVSIQVVSPVNHPPYFPDIVNPIAVSDDISPGTVISTYIKAQDDDQGANGVLTYSLGNDPVANNYFSIDNQTGVLRLKSPLNSTVQSYFVFNVIATDGGFLTATMSISINVLDSRKLGPQFSRPTYTTNVTELMTDLFPPITITATLEPMRHDRVIMYQLSSTLSPQILNLFRVDPNNGSLTMVKGVDYKDTPNKQGYFDLTIMASVVGSEDIPTSTVICRVYVLDTNNHAPYFVPVNYTYKKTIKDSTPPATLMFKLNATDDDVGLNAEVNYYILSGAHDNFVVDPFDGSLTVARSPVLVPETTYNITVIAVDRGQPPLTGTTMVYITVTDSVSRIPVFPFNEYTFYVTEGSVQGFLVGTASAISYDKRAIISYSFSTWKAYNQSDIAIDSNNVQNWFSVSSSTAEIKVQGNIVYSQATKVTVLLLAQVTNPDSNGNLSTTVPVTIFILQKGMNTDVVRFSPDTDFIYIQIYEQLPINTGIFRFNAFYYATSSPVTNFNFFNQSTNGEYLTLERTTGILRTAKVIYYNEVNPTKNITYYLVATAPNPSKANAQAKVVVNILPRSGYNLIFNQSNYYFTVRSNDTPRTPVGQVYALKPPNVDGKIIYRIDTLSDIFEINENGTISLLVRLDTLNSPVLQYTLFVTASLPNNSISRATVSIQVIPVRLLKPIFDRPSYNFSVLQNASGPIGQVFAYDPDPYNKLTVVYSIMRNPPVSDAFVVDPATGIITATGLKGTNSVYVLNVSASVNSAPPMTSYVTVSVQVSSNNQTQFGDFPLDVFSVYFNDPNALIVKVNEPIVAHGRTANFSLDTSALPRDAVNYFYFNNATNELRVNGSINGTVSRNYTLYLVLSDGQSSTSKTLTVGVYSNLPPTFNCKNPPIQVIVADSSPPNTMFYPSVSITADPLCNNYKPGTTFFYSILSSNLSSPMLLNDMFGINSATGEIYSKSTMNAYLLDWTLLRVLVALNESDANTAITRAGAVADVIVRFSGRTIRNPNFDTNNPYCPGSGVSLQRTVMDLSPINFPVVKVHAGSCDMPGYGDVVYTIQGVTFNYYANTIEARDKIPAPPQYQGAFGIDPNSGQVYTNVEELRPFYLGWFSVKVRASARNNGALAADADLMLYVTRESQMLRASFSRGVASVRNDSDKFLRFVNERLMPKYQILPSVITTYVDSSGARNTSDSSMCYALLKLGDSTIGQPSDYYVTSDYTDVKELLNTTILRDNFGLESPFDSCFSGSTLTTKWWSDKWFLWFILIAFSILVFLVALVLTCCVCFYWPMNLKEISKSRPYVVLGDPAMSTGGSVMGERW